MTKVRIEDFSGIAPRMGPKRLPANGAQTAVNTRLESGELRAFNQSDRILQNIVTDAKAVFAMGTDPTWYYLTWGTDVDVARSPVSDSEQRIYYTGDGVPKKTNLAMAIAGGAPYPGTGWLNIGVPAPTTAMSNTLTGTGSVAETRVYFYTYVTQMGSLLEESAPSPGMSVTMNIGQTVNLTGIANPAVTTNYNFVYKRIYRSVGTDALLVAQIPIATTTYADAILAAALPGDVLPSVGWLPPPSDLQGLISLPGGSLAGFRNNELWFSEPGFPHAWPVKYMQTFDYQIVAIAAFSNNVAVATKGYPSVGSGLHPESFSFEKIPHLQPCVSKRSMACDEQGAIYACPNGWMALGINYTGLVTNTLMTRREMTTYQPSTILGVVFDQRYFGFYTANGVTRALVIKRGDSPPMVELAVPAAAIHLEPTTDRLIYVDANTNFLYNLDPFNTLPLTYTWKSKVFEAAYPKNFSCIQVVSSEPDPLTVAAQATLDAANAAINAANIAQYATGVFKNAFGEMMLNEYPLNGSTLNELIPTIDRKVGVYVYAGGILKYSGRLEPNQVARLPSGFRAINWEIALTGQVPVQAVEMSDSVEELKG